VISAKRIDKETEDILSEKMDTLNESMNKKTLFKNSTVVTTVVLASASKDSSMTVSSIAITFVQASMLTDNLLRFIKIASSGEISGDPMLSSLAGDALEPPAARISSSVASTPVMSTKKD